MKIEDRKIETSTFTSIVKNLLVNKNFFLSPILLQWEIERNWILVQQTGGAELGAERKAWAGTLHWQWPVHTYRNIIWIFR